MHPYGVSGLGLAQTYVDAQRIVTALERAQEDPSYFEVAAEILNAYVEPERTLVIEKAIALGADPVFVRSLTTSSGEVIEITGKAPVTASITTAARKIPTWAYVLAGASTLALIIAIARRRSLGV